MITRNFYHAANKVNHHFDNQNNHEASRQNIYNKNIYNKNVGCRRGLRLSIYAKVYLTFYKDQP